MVEIKIKASWLKFTFEEWQWLGEEKQIDSEEALEESRVNDDDTEENSQKEVSDKLWPKIVVIDDDPFQQFQDFLRLFGSQIVGKATVHEPQGQWFDSWSWLYVKVSLNP